MTKTDEIMALAETWRETRKDYFDAQKAESTLRSAVQALEDESARLRQLLREARNRSSEYGMVDLPHDIDAALREE